MREQKSPTNNLYWLAKYVAESINNELRSELILQAHIDAAIEKKTRRSNNPTL